MYKNRVKKTQLISYSKSWETIIARSTVARLFNNFQHFWFGDRSEVKRQDYMMREIRWKRFWRLRIKYFRREGNIICILTITYLISTPNPVCDRPGFAALNLFDLIWPDFALRIKAWYSIPHGFVCLLILDRFLVIYTL